MSALGIGLGLLSALLSALVYLASRRFVVLGLAGEPKPELLPLRLLAVGQVLVGLACLPLAWALDPGGVVYTLDAAGRLWLQPLFIESLCFALGNLVFFRVLRGADASRVTPLLGLKLVALALFAPAMLESEPQLGPLRMGAVVLVLVAALLMRNAGGHLKIGTWVQLSLTCLCFALADIHIRKAIEGARVLAPPACGALQLQAFCAAVSNVVTGAMALLVLPFTRPARLRDWTGAVPYAGAMLATKATYFMSIGLTSVMLAVILQSFRGLFAVLIGGLVAWLGHTHVETRHRGAIIARRIAAALLISAAAAAYVFGG